MVLIGILAAVGAARFYTRTAYDMSAYAEQARALLRYGQKLAIAQNRNVFVTGGVGGLALCYTNASPCPAAQQVAAPAGTNSGTAATRAYCVVNGAYAANWYCEGRPSGVTTSAAGVGLPFYFNGLGKPFLASDLPGGSNPISQTSNFTGLTFTFFGDGATMTITMSPETGYVY